MKKHVEKNNYRSMAEFLRAAIREKMDRDKGIKGLEIKKLDLILSKLDNL